MANTRGPRSSAVPLGSTSSTQLLTAGHDDRSQNDSNDQGPETGSSVDRFGMGSCLVLSRAAFPDGAVERRSGMMNVVKMTEKELIERLAEADRIRVTLRRCTLEWRALGDRIFSERQGGSERPNDRRAARR